MEIELLSFYHNDNKMHDHIYDTRFRKKNAILLDDLANRGIEIECNYDRNNSRMYIVAKAERLTSVDVEDIKRRLRTL